MKGVREAALSKDEPEKEFDHNSFDSDRYDGSYYDKDFGYGSRYGSYRGQGSLFKSSRKTKIKEEEQVEGQLKISLTINSSLVGDLTDEDSLNSDMNAASDKAEILAREALIKLAGEDFESRYSTKVEVEESWDEFEVIITLNPLT